MRQFWDKHKTITRYYETLARAVCERWRLTQMEYDVIMFLHAHPQLNTAADMVRERKLAKSHVSAALAALEKRGYVAKKRTATNKRVVELFLQDKANEVVHAGTDETANSAAHANATPNTKPTNSPKDDDTCSK